MPDYRVSMLMDVLKEETFPILSKLVDDYVAGDIDRETLESHVYMEIDLAVERSYGLRVPFSNGEHEEAFKWMLSYHGIADMSIDIIGLVEKVRKRVRSQYSNEGVDAFLNLKTNKLLFDRISEMKYRNHDMAFKLGIDKLDSRIGGVFPKEILVLTGHQGSMKTSLVLSGVDDSIKKRMSVLFFSLDMHPQALQERRLMRYMNLSQADMLSMLRLPDSPIDKAAVELAMLDDGGIVIEGNNNTDRWNIEKLAETADLIRPHVMIIDFLTLLRKPGQDDLKCANEAMPIIQKITQEYDIRTIVLSQMGRASKIDQRSGNFGGHSKGGGIIEEIADSEIELFKDSGCEDRPDKIIATITKNRRGKSGISYELETDMSSMKFTGKTFEVERNSKGGDKEMFKRKIIDFRSIAGSSWMDRYQDND